MAAFVRDGFVAFHLTPATHRVLRSALRWYRGDMLLAARHCLAPTSAEATRANASRLPFGFAAPPHPAGGWCALPWVRNSLGLNDIYVFRMALPEERTLRHGWFAGEGSDERRHLMRQ